MQRECNGFSFLNLYLLTEPDWPNINYDSATQDQHQLLLDHQFGERALGFAQILFGFPVQGDAREYC